MASPVLLDCKGRLDLTGNRVSRDPRDIAVSSVCRDCPVQPVLLVIRVHQETTVFRVSPESPDLAERPEWTASPVPWDFPVPPVLVVRPEKRENEEFRENVEPPDRPDLRESLPDTMPPLWLLCWDKETLRAQIL